MTDHALRLLRQHPRPAELAAFPFDFDLRRAEHGDEVRLASGGPLEPVAGTARGVRSCCRMAKHKRVLASVNECGRHRRRCADGSGVR